MLFSALFAAAQLSGTPVRAAEEACETDRLDLLKPETQLFLLSQLQFPSDGNFLVVREGNSNRRYDFYQNGARRAPDEISSKTPYCAVISRDGGGLFEEGSKCFTVAHPATAPITLRGRDVGVAVQVTSVQTSKIEKFACYLPGGTPSVQTLRAAFHDAAGDIAISVFNPPIELANTSTRKAGKKPALALGDEQ